MTYINNGHVRENNTRVNFSPLNLQRCLFHTFQHFAATFVFLKGDYSFPVPLLCAPLILSSHLFNSESVFFFACVSEHEQTPGSLASLQISKLSSLTPLSLVQVRAMRLSFVGELGWELHIPKDSCLPVYNAVMAAGAKHGIINSGYRAIDSLSIEKGTLK